LITDQLIFLHIILPFTGTYFAQPAAAAAAATGALADTSQLLTPLLLYDDVLMMCGCVNRAYVKHVLCT